MELNAEAPGDDAKVLRYLWRAWNAGNRYYLAGGTDTHDVWQDESGRVRTFAHIEGPVSAMSYAQSLKAGRAYVSHGPLIFSSILFGSELRLKSGERVPLGVELQSVAGLKSVTLVGAGVVLDRRAFAAAPREAHVDFTLTPDRTWYALVVEDRHGRKAYTDRSGSRMIGSRSAGG